MLEYRLQTYVIVIALILAVAVFVVSAIYDWLLYTVERADMAWLVIGAVALLPVAAGCGYLVGTGRGEAAGFVRGRSQAARAAASTIEREFERAEKTGDAYAKGVEKATNVVMGLAAKVAGVREQAAPQSRRAVPQPLDVQFLEAEFEVLELADGSDVLER